MEIKLSENVKKLRRERELSQETLAERLGVSPQSVSKWERGENFPDITLLPVIANFFGVSVDTLLGTNEIEEAERIKAIVEKLGYYDIHYMRKELAEESETALADHPGSFELMAWVVYAKFDTDPARSIELGEYVLENCTDSGARNRVGRDLALAYLHNGDRDKAKAIAKTLPYGYQTSDDVLADVLTGDEQKKHIQHLCIDLAYNFWHYVRRLKKFYTHEEAIELFKKSNAVYDAIWETDDMPVKLVRKMRNYQGMAEESAALGRDEDVLKYIKLAAECAVLHDALPPVTESASLLFDMHPYDRQYEASMNVRPELLDDLEHEDEFYAGVRDTEEYKKIIGELTAE
ncbi:MAG: helix-turn-helix transcriptional regulator [Clostridia bacterium]|nr:helix-turn-helix transcriptional regulator [Clostridia bacterium]